MQKKAESDEAVTTGVLACLKEAGKSMVQMRKWIRERDEKIGLLEQRIKVLEEKARPKAEVTGMERKLPCKSF